jgi:hypothetical protein
LRNKLNKAFLIATELMAAEHSAFSFEVFRHALRRRPQAVFESFSRHGPEEILKKELAAREVTHFHLQSLPGRHPQVRG